MAQCHLIAEDLQLLFELFACEPLSQRRRFDLVDGRIIIQLNGSLQTVSADPGALKEGSNPGSLSPELGIRGVAVQGDAKVVQRSLGVLLHNVVVEKVFFFCGGAASLVFDTVDHELAMVLVRQVKRLGKTAPDPLDICPHGG
jgi:hypothetical protein